MDWYFCLYGSVLYSTASTLFGDGYIRRFVEKIYLPLLLVALVVFVGFRSPNVDRDYGQYVDWFNRVSGGHLLALDWAKDPAFVAVSYVISWTGLSYVGVALVYAVLALLLQACFARLVSGQRYLTICFYLIVCMTFLNYDMTEIRAGVAVPLMSISILLAMRGRRAAAGLLYALALATHLSVLIGIPLFLLAMISGGISSRWWILMLGPSALAADLLLHPLLPLLVEAGRVSDYLNGNSSTESIRLLSVYFLVRIMAVAAVTIFYWGKLSREERLAVLCSGFGLLIQIVFSFNGALGLRGAEVFALFDVWVLTMPATRLKAEWRTAYVLALVLLGYIFFRSGLKIIHPYSII
jgi:hypothetical protein